jgi:hypothetical protein
MCTLFLAVPMPIGAMRKMGLMFGTRAARLCGARDKRHRKPNCHQKLEAIHRTAGTARTKTLNTVLGQERLEQMSLFVQI